MKASHPALMIDVNEAVESALAEAPIDPRTVEADFDKIDGRISELSAEKSGIELALAIELSGKHPEASPSFLATADPYKLLVKSPKRAIARLEDIDELLDELQPKWRLLRDQRQLAREEAARAFALTFKPRHRKAVQAIARALESLSAAVAAEQDLHLEFQEHMPGFAVLPDFGGAWRGALLNNSRSSGSDWVRAAKRAGLLDE